jgi:hypothetical protein
MSTAAIGTYNYSGYYTCKLPTPVALAAGDTFSVVIKYVNNSYTYPIPIEGYIAGYTSGATNASGQSYYSSNGTSWTDFTNYNSNTSKYNCTIKAFTGFVPKNDFNGDGQEDILWRYYGPGGYNYVWYMGQSGSGIPGLQTMNSRLTNMFQRPAAAKVYWDAREAGGFLEKTAGKVYRDAWEAAGLRSWKKAPTISDGQFGMPGKAKGIRILKTPVENTVGLLGSMCIGTAFLPAVLDVNWQVAGTGDFNGDGKVDILWRYYGGGGAQGLNYVWYMDGVTCLGGVLLPAVLDTSWQIAGTGDFNGDGKVDILWRYYNPSQQMILCVNGENYVWYMNDVTCTGTEFLPPVPDTNWRIQNH